ncbi:MAG: flagellar hook-length control protein FliK [Natronospirillum sp.]|uniref:flagellar hook-length control protein FliK n=1 Tax=Natronospirillum sp. TaxID=2812955 RepID=UPI0025E95B51|nr:flagellar hook-length control protein FliK [Natronospirillum sp.]MCH8552160.1 flagellar hook-length control protein FliK [Natronospirillum sp.]
MAKIDGIGRMRLPPDSGIRAQPHSERERATSEPLKRALTDWFQAVRQGREGSTDPALTDALRNILADRVQRGEPVPRFLPLQVLSSLEPGKNGLPRFQVQLGQSLLELTSRANLQPGQTLVMAASDRGPIVLVPKTPEQFRLVDALVQRQQLSLLPAVQRQVSLNPVQAWLNQSPAHATQAPTAPPNQASAPQPPGAPVTVPASPLSPVASAALQSGSVTPAASWMAQLLPVVLQAWQSALPGVNATDTLGTRLAAAAPSLPGMPAGASPVPATASDAGARPSAQATPNEQRLQLSQHWIPQLIETARRDYGSATPETVRQVWQNWQQGATSRLQTTPMPDLSRVPLSPADTGGRTSAPVPVPLLNAGATPLTTANPLTAGTATAAGSESTLARPTASVPAPGTTTSAAPASAGGAPSATPTTGNAGAETTLNPAQLVPILRAAMRAPTEAATTPTQRSEPQALPADVWRVIAEQVLDQRLQQLGQSGHPSLQEQLQRRADQLRSQRTMTYSPEQLRQKLGQRTASAGDTTGGTQSAQQQEQQTLMQLRQTLEQAGQQQLVRALQSILPDNPAEPARLVQGIPVMSDQQLLWFELERHRPHDEDEAGEEPASSNQWVLDLHFHLPPLAPVCARLHWQGETAELTFLTNDTPTLRLFHNHLEGLQQRLEDLALPVEEVQCRYGLPRRKGRSGSSDQMPPSALHQIDVHT